MTDLTIIIPTLNEARFLGPLLTSIANQTHKPQEVIIVDGGSTDATITIAGAFKEQLNMTVLQAPKGIGLARNMGAAAAKTTYLLFLDADVELEDPTFIAAGLQEFNDRRLGIASAHFYVGAHASIWDRFGAWLISNYHGLFQYSRRIPMGSGFCLLTTRQLHDAIGGFNEAYRHSEDHDYVTRMVQAGHTYRLLKKPRFKLSNRRYQEQGRAPLITLYIKAEVNRVFFNYRFAPREEALYNFGIFSEKRK